MQPRNLSLVKFNEGYTLPPGMREKYPFAIGETLLFVGDVINMPEHCVVVKSDGNILWGFHSDNFVELTDDEV
mgnify:CR=1 FL=1